MKKYTKEQLIAAQMQYIENYNNDPESFNPCGTAPAREEAEDVINYLLAIADEQIKQAKSNSKPQTLNN